MEAHHQIIENPQKKMKLILLDDSLLEGVISKADYVCAAPCVCISGLVCNKEPSAPPKPQNDQLTFDADIENHLKMKNFIRLSDKKFQTKWQFFSDTEMVGNRNGKRKRRDNDMVQYLGKARVTGFGNEAIVYQNDRSFDSYLKADEGAAAAIADEIAEIG